MRLFQTINKTLQNQSKQNPPGWVLLCYFQFVEFISNKDPIFPCYFATNAHTQKALFYSYIEPLETDSPLELINTLCKYLISAREFSHYTALIIFIKTKLSNQRLEYYRKVFWELLQYIHDNDLKLWPDTIPKNPNNLDWKFCFNGIPVFINGHSSAYQKRKSRSAPCDLMLVIQPLENLTKLKRNSKSVQAISNKIRDYVESYDLQKISRVFGKNFADSKILNWKQFWLTDTDNELEEEYCPLKIK